MTVAIDASRAKAHPSAERRRDASVSLSLRAISGTAASNAPRHWKLCIGWEATMMYSSGDWTMRLSASQISV
jgi:hypothetical protein